MEEQTAQDIREQVVRSEFAQVDFHDVRDKFYILHTGAPEEIHFVVDELCEFPGDISSDDDWKVMTPDEEGSLADPGDDDNSSKLLLAKAQMKNESQMKNYSVNDEDTKKSTFVCDYCHKAFESKAHIKRHMTTFDTTPHKNIVLPYSCVKCVVVLCSDDQCSECPKAVAKISKIEPGNMLHKTFKGKHENKRFECKVCTKAFRARSLLIIHEISHSNEKPFKCNVCSKAYKYKCNWTMHMRAHTVQESFECEVCLETFSVKDDLYMHKRWHTGKQEYQCNVCAFTSSYQASLILHTRTHTGEKPYQCDICSMRFTLNHHLSIHKRTHSGVKPFKCGECNKLFSDKSNCVRHMKSHKGTKNYKCNLCPNAYTRKLILRDHMLKMHFKQASSK